MFPLVTFANTDHIKAAFIRDGNLWTLIGDKETQITKENMKVFSPKWSSDGKWILYQVASTNEFGEENEV
jgi:Tol biopolymer transport system component